MVTPHPVWMLVSLLVGQSAPGGAALPAPAAGAPAAITRGSSGSPAAVLRVRPAPRAVRVPAVGFTRARLFQPAPAPPTVGRPTVDTGGGAPGAAAGVDAGGKSKDVRQVGDEDLGPPFSL